MRLHEKVALVTGGGSGIGQALAYGFAAEGAAVAVNDVRAEAAAATVAEIEARGGRGCALMGDVADAGLVARVFEQAVERFGRLDVLANIAGIYPRRLVADMEADEWDRVLGINLRGVFLCSRAALRSAMLRQGSGAILNIVSGLGVAGARAGSAYAASKGGVIAFTRSLAAEVAAQGIRVNAIGPGVTDTPLARGANTADELAAAARATIAGRMGEPGDVVPTAVFLCSDEASTVTGQVWFLR